MVNLFCIANEENFYETVVRELNTKESNLYFVKLEFWSDYDFKK